MRQLAPNTYALSGKSCDVWLVGTDAGSFVFLHDRALGIERFAEWPDGDAHPLGEHPAAWLFDELSQDGWDNLLGVHEECGWREDNPEDAWMLRRSLAHGQPFRVRVFRPRGTVSHTPDGTEYDTVYCEPELLQVLSWPAERAARTWGAAFSMWPKKRPGYQADPPTTIWVPR